MRLLPRAVHQKEQRGVFALSEKLSIGRAGICKAVRACNAAFFVYDGGISSAYFSKRNAMRGRALLRYDGGGMADRRGAYKVLRRRVFLYATKRNACKNAQPCNSKGVRKLQAFPRTKGAIKEVEKISDRLKRVDIYFAIGYNIRNQRPAYSAGENGGRFMFEKVCNMLAEQLGISADTITPASEVVKDLGADSLDVVELMMALEDEYGVTLPEGEVENLKTVQDIVSMLEKLQK